MNYENLKDYNMPYLAESLRNELQGMVMNEDKGQYNFSRPFKNRQKVLFRFDDDEPVEICIMDKETEFSISLNDNGTIQFEKNGKTLTIYTEDL